MFYFFLTLNLFTVLALNSPGVYQVTEPVEHGESPIYKNGLLFFVSTFEGKVLCYNETNQKLNSIQLGGDTSTIIPLKSNPHQLLIGVNRSIVIVDWNGENEKGLVKVLTEISPQYPQTRINDGKADKKGRLWIGTVGPTNQSVLYLITSENLNNPSSIIAPITVSNGLAWNKANNKFYFIDSPTRKVLEFDYNENGTISNPKTIFDLSKTIYDGLPDGMTIDYEDNLWIALWGGGGVIKINTNGTVLQFIPIPAYYVTSVIWGGPNYDILYVTTSKHILKADDKIKQPSAGSVFAVTNLGTYGLPTFDVNL